MKVNKDSLTNPILPQSTQNCKEQNVNEPIEKVCAKNIEKDAASCLAQMGKAQVFMQNSCAAQKTSAAANLQSPQNPQSDEEITEIIQNILQPQGLQLGYFRGHGKFVSAGRPIEGFKGLCYDDYRAACIKDENGMLQEIYFLNNSNGAVKVFDANGDLKKDFSAQEMKALKEYKYAPNSFHEFLRYGRPSGLPSQKELEGFINDIENIYNDDKKVWKTQKPTTVYRALQDKLTEEQIKSLSKIGGEYIDTSFVSTSTRKETAMMFAHHNPILEIELPENTKYIDLDTLFNIDRRHWNEKEFLLNKNSRFIVTGFEPENNIIKVKLAD